MTCFRLPPAPQVFPAFFRSSLPVLLLAGCSGSTPPAPNTYIEATLGPHLDSTGVNLCSNASPVVALSIGTAASTPIGASNGDTFQGAGVSVDCTVNGGFTVKLEASRAGSGTVNVVGSVSASGGSGLYGNIVSNGSSYQENDCTIAYTYMGSAVPTTPIAAGRIWGHLKCPSMVTGASKLVGGMTVSETCDGEADFFFQNCGQ